MLDVQRTVISQYASSPVLNQIIASFDQWVDPGQNIEDFFRLVWDLDTAQGWGLDVWARIVGVGRVLQVAAGNYLGFTGPSGVSGDPYDVSPWYSGGATTSNFALSDNGFRTLIYAKAAANIWDGSIPGLNAILMRLFAGRGDSYVIDNGNMTMEYHFNFAVTPVDQAIVFQSGVLPKPVGVSAIVTHL